jgi:hypothetical protein
MTTQRGRRTTKEQIEASTVGEVEPRGLNDSLTPRSASRTVHDTHMSTLFYVRHPA